MLSIIFRSICSVVILLSFLCCFFRSSGARPRPKRIFTLTIAEGYDLKKDSWIFLNDNKGNLLFSTQLRSPSEVKFETTDKIPDNEFTVTLFTYDSGRVYKDHILKSYSAQRTGQSWHFTAKPVTAEKPIDPTGYISVNYTLPSNCVMDIIGNQFTLGQHMRSGQKKSYRLGFTETPATQKFMLAIAGDTNPRYRFFENVKDGQVFDVDFNAMTEFDKIVNVEIPLVTNPQVDVIGYEPDGLNSYYLYLNRFNLPPFGSSKTISQINIGYLKRFTTYLTRLAIGMNNCYFNYEKMGSPPTAINVLTASPFAVTNKTFADYAFTSSMGYQRRTTGFRHQSLPEGYGFMWEMNTDTGNEKVSELPKELLKKYPLIKPSQLTHYFSSFYYGTESYQDFVDQNFHGKPRGDSYEVSYVRIQ